MAQNWLNKDNLFLQFGTDKTTSEAAGDFLAYGENRVMEVRIDLTALSTSTASILSNTTIFPAGTNTIIEKVELVVDTAVTGSSSTLKVGLIQLDRATVPSNYDHAFINGEVLANMATLGDKLVYVGADSIPAGSTHGGILIGSTASSTTGPYYLTAQAGTAVFTAGVIKVRIYYRGIGSISQ